MRSSDYRRIAREKLVGNWGIAILAALVAWLLGGLLTSGNFSLTLNLDGESITLTSTYIHSWLISTLRIGLVLGIVQFIIGGVVRQGYCQFLLKQHDGQEAELNDLFSQFHRFGDGFCLMLLQGLFTLLWALLLIIPGFVAIYRYAMAPFLMAENPEMTASEAIAASKTLMDGHKWELFCLDLSFLGWVILSTLTLGIGTLFLNPYMNAAHAAFYREISSLPTVE